MVDAGGLHRLDVSVFRHVNGTWTFGLFDTVMPWLTRAGTNDVVWVAVALMLALRCESRVASIAALVALAVTTPAFVLVKQAVERDRPYFALDHVRSLVPMLHSYSFPSGHAATSFAAWSAIAWSLRGATTKTRRWTWSLAALAVAIAYSRVYVGAHYPSDVLGGAALGCACGIASAQLVLLARKPSERRLSP